MSNRKQKEPIQVDGKPVVGVMEAARILSRKAREKGVDRIYSRDSIYRRYKEGTLKPAMETPAGNLYFVEDIEKIEIAPHVGKRSPKTEEERRACYRQGARLRRLTEQSENLPQNP